MYLPFFGLNEKPFAITPDPRYLFLSERHAEALAHLVYGITEAGGFIQLTGEVGTGKTTIIRSLLAQIPKNAEVALILNPRMTAPEFLLTICEELGIGVPDSAENSVKELVDILNRYLLRAHADGRRIVLVVDEAQNLSPDVLEQVRLLTNLETETQKLLQIILIGQPELRELLARNDLRQLAQRITGRFHLDPLARDEASAYVRHRLRVAGATRDIFNAGALADVYRVSGGIPRVINVICDRALLGAYTQDRHSVTPTIVRRAAGEVFGRRFAPPWLPWAGVAASVVLLAMTTFAVWKWSEGSTRDSAPAATATTTAANGTASVATAAPSAAGSAQPGASGSITGATAAGTAAPAPGTANVAASLPDLLRTFKAETDTDSAFAKLFSLWGAQYVPGTEDPCLQATRKGLECLVQRGSLAELRLYNRPAILMLSDASGTGHQVVLAALDDERVQIELGGARRVVGVGALSRYWFGDYVLLWRPGAGRAKPLSLGTRGAEVRWLRESLARIAGSSVDVPMSDLYDAELVRAVRDFQRRHQIDADGIAGVQTQILVDAALGSPDSPFLHDNTTHGG